MLEQFNQVIFNYFFIVSFCTFIVVVIEVFDTNQKFKSDTKKFSTMVNAIKVYNTFFVVIFLYHLILFFYFDLSLKTPQIFLQLNIWGFYFEFYIDNMSFLFVVLTSFMCPIAYLIHYSNLQNLIQGRISRAKQLYVLQSLLQSARILLIVQVTLIILFSTSNLFLFYIAFELSMLPVFIYIGIYGSRINKLKASYYIFVYTMIFSIPFLIGLLILYLEMGTLNYFILIKNPISVKLQQSLAVLFFIPFATKIPLIPFHVWLPEAHVEASTENSIILASLLLKTSFYGLIRFVLPLCLEGILYFSPILYTWACISMIYASLSIFLQVDLKKIIAYSSIIHMNYALLGLLSLTVEGIQGCLYICFTHGIISSALFVIAGSLYKSYKTRLVSYYSGIVIINPLLSSFAFLFILGNMSFPGIGSFVGELLSLIGVYEISFLLGTCLLFSSLLTTLYNMLMYTNLFLGLPRLVNYENSLTLVEFYICVTFVLLMFSTGCAPNNYLSFFYMESWSYYFITQYV